MLYDASAAPVVPTFSGDVEIYRDNGRKFLERGEKPKINPNPRFSFPRS